MKLLTLIVSMFFDKKRHENCLRYFSVARSLGFCSNVENLYEEIGIAHDSSDWRLFTNTSLKCVLFHNGNQYLSIPVGHSVQMKEDSENVKFLFDGINHAKYNGSSEEISK